MTLHNVVPHEPQLHDKSMFHLVLHLSNKVIVHNLASRNAAKSLYGESIARKIVIIPCGPFSVAYEDKVGKDEARNFLKLKNSDFVLVFFGSIRPYKNLDLLLRAFREASGKLPDARLVIAGNAESPYGAQVLRQAREIENCFVFLRHIPEEEVQFYMRASDVGVLPYSESSTPGALLLLMSFDLPVIVPSLPSIRELVDDSSGILFEPNSIGGLVDAIEKAYRVRPKLEIMGENARKRSTSSSWPNIATLTLRAYLSVLRT